jgi:hypothetical protein
MDPELTLTITGQWLHFRVEVMQLHVESEAGMLS